MRPHISLLIISAILCSFALPLRGQTDELKFSAVCESGQTLYYKVTSNNEPYTVEITSETSSLPNYSEKPYGNLDIPSSITHNSKIYSVTSIGENAFSWCDRLTSVTIPNSVTNIGKEAFSDCRKLTLVIIPNSISNIGNEVFIRCGLTSITIPSSVTHINYNAFSCCGELESITIDKQNPKYDSRNNCNAIIETATNELILGCVNTFIPNSIKSIGTEAFARCRKLESITIPNSIISIGDKAFAFCYELKSIKIPNSVKSIGYGAFCNCIKLMSIAIPDSVINIDGYAFYGCKKLSSVTIPNSVTRIDYGAFAGCINLTDVYIPNSVTYIGDDAFGGCSNLKEPIYNDNCFAYFPDGYANE